MSEDDIASEREDFFRNEALRKTLVKCKPPEGFDGVHCQCGEVIPPLRLALPSYRCVGCQVVEEKRLKLFRR